MRFNVCGAVGADVRSNWNEKAERESLTGESSGEADNAGRHLLDPGSR
jgi:hypothetical protein